MELYADFKNGKHLVNDGMKVKHSVYGNIGEILSSNYYRDVYKIKERNIKCKCGEATVAKENYTELLPIRWQEKYLGELGINNEGAHNPEELICLD